jgi:hypothetical protein
MSDPRRLYGEPHLKLAGLAIWALGWQFPNSEDYWDGNWLNVYARVEAFGARIDTWGSWLRTNEIHGLRDGLVELNRDLKGTAELACIEPTLNVKLSCDSLGRVEVVVRITPDHLTQAHHFDFSIDQTFLGPVISECNRMLERFPVRGLSPGQV